MAAEIPDILDGNIQREAYAFLRFSMDQLLFLGSSYIKYFDPQRIS
jgi:hypothetical protein